MADLKRCKTPFATTVDGMVRVVTAGAIVSTDDPAYTKGTAEHFEDIETYAADQAGKRRQAAGVEDTSAAPGEKRSLLGKIRGSAPAEPAETPAGADVEPERPKGNAPKEDWAAYAASRKIAVADDASYADIKAAVAAADEQSGDNQS
jgi:hypothetical protein